MWARLRGLEAAQRASVAIASAVPNQGNMGLPMTSLAFGATGLEFGTVLFVVGIVLNASAAVALGAMALGEHTPGRALLAPLRYPSIYAAAAGVIVNVLNVDLPVAIEEPIATLADASIPCMLVVLGLSFHLPKPGHLEHPIAVSINRLVLGPLAAFALVSLVGLHGTARDVTILMAGMPAAVNTTILAGRLGADVPLAVRIVVVSTSLSIVTLTVLLTSSEVVPDFDVGVRSQLPSPAVAPLAGRRRAEARLGVGQWRARPRGHRHRRRDGRSRRRPEARAVRLHAEDPREGHRGRRHVA